LVFKEREVRLDGLFLPPPERPDRLALILEGALLSHCLIVATALVHSLVVVTPNLADFAATGVPLLNPWQQGEGRTAQMAATDRGFQ